MGEEVPLSDLVVNDRYWLQWARASTDATIGARITAGEKLTTALGWFWTVYTAIALVGVAFSKRPLSLALGTVVFLPVALLVGAYLLATRVLMPVDLEFDPRVPDEIQAAYLVAAETTRARLRTAYRLAAVAGLSVVVAGIATAMYRPPPADALVVGYSDGSGRPQILVDAQVVPDQDVKLTAVPVDAGLSEAPVAVVGKASETGELRTSMPVGGTAKRYEVTVEWTLEGLRRTLSRTVTP